MPAPPSSAQTAAKNAATKNTSAASKNTSGVSDSKGSNQAGSSSSKPSSSGGASPKGPGASQAAAKSSSAKSSPASSNKSFSTPSGSGGSKGPGGSMAAAKVNAAASKPAASRAPNAAGQAAFNKYNASNPTPTAPKSIQGMINRGTGMNGTQPRDSIPSGPPAQTGLRGATGPNGEPRIQPTNYGTAYQTAQRLRDAHPKQWGKYGQTEVTEGLLNYANALPGEADVNRYPSGAMQNLSRVGINKVVGGRSIRQMVADLDTSGTRRGTAQFAQPGPNSMGLTTNWADAESGKAWHTLGVNAIGDAVDGRGVSPQAMDASNFVAAGTPMVRGVNEVGAPVHGTQFGHDPTWGNRIANRNEVAATRLNSPFQGQGVPALQTARPAAPPPRVDPGTRWTTSPLPAPDSLGFPGNAARPLAFNDGGVRKSIAGFTPPAAPPQERMMGVENYVDPRTTVSRTPYDTMQSPVPQAPRNPSGGMSFTPGLPQDPRNPVGGMSFNPGLPQAPRNPSGGMSFTPGLPHPTQKQDYARVPQGDGVPSNGMPFRADAPGGLPPGYANRYGIGVPSWKQSTYTGAPASGVDMANPETDVEETAADQDSVYSENPIQGPSNPSQELEDPRERKARQAKYSEVGATAGSVVAGPLGAVIGATLGWQMGKTKPQQRQQIANNPQALNANVNSINQLVEQRGGGGKQDMQVTNSGLKQVLTNPQAVIAEPQKYTTMEQMLAALSAGINPETGMPIT